MASVAAIYLYFLGAVMVAISEGLMADAGGVKKPPLLRTFIALAGWPVLFPAYLIAEILRKAGR